MLLLLSSSATHARKAMFHLKNHYQMGRFLLVMKEVILVEKINLERNVEST